MPLKNSLWFPAIQAVHLTGIVLLAGTIILIDLRLLGYALLRHDVAELRRRLGPWMRTGLGIMLITGSVLYAADVSRYTSNPAFLAKMAVLLAALVFQFGVHNKVLEDRRAKMGAMVSIALWTCVVLGGRAIADFDI